MRKAFSMITAIFIIVLMATVGAFILNISAKSVKSTVLQFKREQAILYARSYTELAIMTAGTATASPISGSADGNYTINATWSAISSDFIIVDVSVSYPDYDSAVPIVYRRRTLQKL